MKPSERRALEAEKRAQREAEARERELTKKNKDTSTEENISVSEDTMAEQTDSADIPQSAEPYKRKEGFFQSHIRLITFIITATLILTVLGPIGIDMLVAAKRDKVINNKEDISIDRVYSVYDNASVIEWKNFRNFNYTDYSYESQSGDYQVREYPISGLRLKLKVGGPKLSNRPDYVYLIDYKTGEYINVLKEDPRDFVRLITD